MIDPYSDRRRPAAAESRRRGSRRFLAGRGGRSTSPTTTSTWAGDGRPRPRRDPGAAGARRRGSVPLQRRPPQPDPGAAAAGARRDADRSFGVSARSAIAGVPDLMHHKYVVRDGETVWTGSMNWTDDSFDPSGERRSRSSARRRSRRGPSATSRSCGRPAPSSERAASSRGRVDVGDRGARVVHARVRRGALDRIAKAIARARRRVRICSPVIYRRAGACRSSPRSSPRASSTSRGCVDPTAGARRAPPVASERERRVEAPAARARDEGRSPASAPTPWRPRRRPAQLHAREADGRRRPGASRELQPLALG